MFESENLLVNAFSAAVYDRLYSAVYYALNYTIGYLDGLEEESPSRDKLIEEWRELGAYAVAGVVVLSTLPEGGSSLRHAVGLIPWIAEYLRDYDEEAVLPIVQQWLDGKPLAERISANPQDEEMKVRELKRLISAIDENAKPTVSKVIRSV